ncbi:MAG: hypothetical protein WC204_11825, partial [Elusimicrobiales bacterium]
SCAKRAGSNEPVSFAQQRCRQKTAIAAKIPYVGQAPSLRTCRSLYANKFNSHVFVSRIPFTVCDRRRVYSIRSAQLVVDHPGDVGKFRHRNDRLSKKRSV